MTTVTPNSNNACKSENLCDISYSLTKEILVDARSVSEFSGKKQVDRNDVDFAIKTFNEKHCKDRPSRAFISELAAEKNAHPLPPIRQNFGLRLPNDRFCQLQPNYVYIEKDSVNADKLARASVLMEDSQPISSTKFAAMNNFDPDSVSNLLMTDKSVAKQRKRPYPNEEKEKSVPDEDDDDYD
uniref:Transcription factor CBF/NF-Y/archaeal histone domain-containing protein n=1 Tax=Globodera rostochiensis TaxID=31243 RepID=A0A914HTN9_GLORO